MKIAVTSKGRNLDAEVDPRFGRAEYIVIVDSDNRNIEVLDKSKNSSSAKDAGIKAAAIVNDHGAAILLTGFCGPNAFKAL